MVAREILPWAFVLGQVLYLHPLNFPIWLAGLGWFFFAKDATSFRALGWVYLVIPAEHRSRRRPESRHSLGSWCRPTGLKGSSDGQTAPE